MRKLNSIKSLIELLFRAVSRMTTYSRSCIRPVQTGFGFHRMLWFIGN
nr:MAG TPA: hypothetical protein [Caudoviricetes sp.]